MLGNLSTLAQGDDDDGDSGRYHKPEADVPQSLELLQGGKLVSCYCHWKMHEKIH